MWDTWLFPHEGRYHLFFLQRRAPEKSDQVGRAVSDDLIHWEPLPSIHLRGPEGAWDGALHETGLRTGCTIRHGDGFAMPYGAVHEGRELVGMTFSDDLVTWRKCDQNPVLRPGGECYETDPQRSAMFWVPWRDPFIEPVEGGYEALLCARTATGDHGARACIARVFSRDLIHWEPRPPLAAPGRYNSMECPERFEMDGRWYLTFSTGTEWGRPLNTPTRDEVHGGFYMIGKHRDGPYAVPEDDLLIGCRLLSSTAFDACPEYAARTIIGPGGERLLYGQNIGDRVAFSTPKVLEADGAAHLHVKFWEELLRLETGTSSEGFAGLTPFRMGNVLLGEWQVNGDRAVVDSGPDTTIATLPEIRSDFHWTIDIVQHSGERVAFLLRVDENLKGTAVVLDFAANTISLAGVGRGNQFGILLTHYDIIRRALSPGSTYSLRILARDEFIEAYLDDSLLFSVTQRKHGREGRLGFAVLGKAEFSRNRVAALEGLA